jgi:hypothetical protein
MMALIKCHECGKKVSTESASCPNCGAAVRIPVPKSKASSGKPVNRVLLAILGLLLFGSILSLEMQKHKSPEELKEEADAQRASQERKIEEDKRNAVETKRISAAATAAQAIKKSARNPDSVSWEDIMTNEDGTVTCIELRAQNGFGGMSLEDIAVVNGQIKTSDAAWNKNCANKHLYDVKENVIRVMKLYE